MSKILPLVFHPDQRLRELSVEIDQNNIPDLVSLASDMSETMIVDKGIGLAAPQIGQNIRLIIVSTKSGPQVMFNPKIVKKSIRQEWGEEGCLSIPGVFGNVKRYRTVECSFFDTKGQRQVAEAEGLLARVIQHEIDHLDGILFIDKAKDIRQE
ncbi:peptide deformylase [Candidatus Falkowbacteria bacterium]|nr:MAG: peptide deformylase [Candidatus Falkowbacteria bacterium]